jgi:hypothetical protein
MKISKIFKKVSHRFYEICSLHKCKYILTMNLKAKAKSHFLIAVISFFAVWFFKEE